MKRLSGRRYLVPLREGGSLPAVVETDEPGAYVVKFRGAGQGVKALIAEALAAELALLLGLPIPAPAVVDLDAGFGQGEPDPEIQDILRGSVGANFGLGYLAGALAFDPAADRAFDPDLAAAIVWFDAFITNVDRTARNTNLLHWRGAYYLIDHGASLYFHHRSGGWEKNARASFPQIKDHVLLPFAGDIIAAGARLAPLLTEAAIRAVAAAVPDEWLMGEAHFADPAAYRAAYVAYLLPGSSSRAPSNRRRGMPPPSVWYSYAVVRVVPRVERGEFLNVGIILFARTARFLAACIEIDRPRLRAFAPDLDLEAIEIHLDAFVAICDGRDEGGPIARLPLSERFHWLTAPRSAVIQTSPVHIGRDDNPRTALDALCAALVRSG